MDTDAHFPTPLQLNKDLRPQIQQVDYQLLQPYIDAAQAIARLTYQSVYIIDYARMGFAYVSDNPLFLGGMSVEEVQTAGYRYYEQRVPEDDLHFLEAVNQAGFEFYCGIPVDERMRYTISYNFHIKHRDTDQLIFINHQITPLKLDLEGNIWLGLCLVSLAPTGEQHTAYISAIDSRLTWQFTRSSRRWRLYETAQLNEHEKAIIRLANQGLSTAEIARQIYRSEDSVKGYKKKLFAKLGVESISEAIAVATLRRLI